MSRLLLALRTFFRILMDKSLAERVEPIIGPQPGLIVTQTAPPAPAPKPVLAPEPLRPLRSEALTLLSALQREARLVDFLKEPIAAYTDAQIGAAVRDVHRDSAAALERMFALRPVIEQAEGATVEVAGAEAARVHLMGNVAGQPPYRGVLRHGGWQATKIEIPEWSGSEPAARIVAPAEVELP